MRIWLIILFIFCSLVTKAQVYGFPTPIADGGKPNILVNKGTYGTTTGFTFLNNFSDTASANIPSFIKDQPGIMILVGTGELWIRNSQATAWIPISGSSTPTINMNIGTMYSKTSWADLSDFIDQSSGASISGNKIYFTGGAGTFTKTLGISMYNGLETYETSIIVIADTTKYAGASGISLGSRSVNTSFPWQYAARFYMTNTSDSGKVAIYIGGSSYTLAAKSSTGINFTQGDRILLKVSAEKNIITISASNITTVGTPVSVSYQYNYAGTPDWVANTGNVSIYNLGGKFHVDSIGWQSNEPINSSMFIGDSKTTGGVVTDVNYRFGQKYNNSYGTAVINAGVSDQTAQIKLLIPQIINYIRPVQVFLEIGSNDIRAGVPTATWQANYNYIDSALTANGIVVYNLTPFPETVLNQSALYSYILSTYSPSRIIDTYDALSQCGNCLFSDGVHPNDAGNELIFTTIKNFSPPYADKLNNPVFNLRNQRLAFQDFNFWVDTAITQWVRVNTTSSSNYRINAPDSVILNGIILSKARSGFGTPTIHVPGGFLSIQNDIGGAAAGANMTIFESVDNHAVELRFSSVNAAQVLTPGVGIINGFNYNSATRQPLYITTSGFGATTAGPVIIRPGTNWSNASLGFGNSGDSAIIELNPSATYRAKFYVNGKQDVQDTFTTKSKSILFTTVGGSSDSVLVKSSTGDTRAVAQSSIGGTNIYNSDGTLSANRTLALGGFSLSIDRGYGGFNSNITTTNTDFIQRTNSTNYTEIYGTSNGTAPANNYILLDSRSGSSEVQFFVYPDKVQMGSYGSGTHTGTPTFTLQVDASGNVIEGTGGTGTVTSVSFTGGLISVGTPTTTPAFTVAGTSGGIPYFSSTSTWASSALLAANALMIGGGAGTAPSTTTTGSGVLTFLGTPSWTNFNSMITGTAPFWSLATGGTLTGTNTITAGSNPLILSTGVTTGTGATAGFQITANSLTSGNGFDMSSSSLQGGTIVKITSTSTALAAGNEGLDINISGANGTNAITATGIRSTVTNTNATSGTNIAAQFNASGATTVNWALFTGSATGGDGRVNVNNATNDANHVMIVKGTTNNTFEGLKVLSNNESVNTVVAWNGIRGSGDFAVTSSTGNITLNTLSSKAIQVTSKMYIGAATTPTAILHILAGTATANTAPIKLTTGTSLTAAEAGAIEYTTPQLFFTNGGGQRQEIPQIQQTRVSTQYDNTTTTLGNVTGLTATLVAGKIYRFEATLYTTSNVAGGIKVAIAGTATATAIIYEGLVTDAGLTTQGRTTTIGTAVAGVTAVTAAYVRITGLITVNAAGTLTVQAAANAATGTTSVLVGSTFVTTEMP